MWLKNGEFVNRVRVEMRSALFEMPRPHLHESPDFGRG